MKSRTFTILISLCLLLSACNLPASPQASPSRPTEKPAATHTSLPPATATEIPLSATPSPVPSPTLPPTPDAPRGTLSLAQEFGLGTGLTFTSYGLQLSGDETRLIVTTSAGIFSFSADDLSLLSSIYEPTRPFGYPVQRQIRIARDGSLAVSLGINAEYQSILKFWDLASGSQLAECLLEDPTNGESQNISDFALSPDNSQVLAVNETGQLLVISVDDAKIVKTIDDFANNTRKPLWVEFDPTGKNAYYLFQDVSVVGVQSHGFNSVSWEEISSEVIDTIDFPWEVGAFAPLLSKPAGFRWGYFTRPGSDTISAWDYSTFGKRFDIERQDPISALAFSPDGQTVIMAGIRPAQLEVWAVETVAAPLQAIPLGSRLWAVAATSGGESLYGIANDGSLLMWKSGQANPVHQVTGFLPVARGLSFSEDGLGLQLTISDTEVYEINPQDGSFKNTHANPDILPEMKDNVLVGASVSADKSLLAALYFQLNEYGIHLFDLSSGKLIRKIPSKYWLETVEFAPDGRSLFVYGRKQPAVQVLDIETGKVLQEIAIKPEFGRGLTEMSISRDKSRLMLLGETGLIEIYRTDTLELVQTLESGEYTWVTALSDDGSLLAYYSLDGTLYCWDITSNTLLAPLALNLPDVVTDETNLAFSPDNLQLAFSTGDGVIRMYDVAP